MDCQEIRGLWILALWEADPEAILTPPLGGYPDVLGEGKYFICNDKLKNFFSYLFLVNIEITISPHSLRVFHVCLFFENILRNI